MLKHTGVEHILIQGMLNFPAPSIKPLGGQGAAEAATACKNLCMDAAARREAFQPAGAAAQGAGRARRAGKAGAG